MRETIIIAAVALGTYLLRYLPLRASSGKLSATSSQAQNLNRGFEIAGICVIAALFLSSLSLPEGQSPAIGAIRVAASLAVVAAAGYKWRNPGVGVLLGILCFALSPLLL